MKNRQNILCLNTVHFYGPLVGAVGQGSSLLGARV